MNMRFHKTVKQLRMGNQLRFKALLVLAVMTLFLSVGSAAFAQLSCVFVPGQGFVCTGTPPPPVTPPPITPPPGGGVTLPGVNPATGFPFFFQDVNGVQVQLCDVVGVGIEAPPCAGLALTNPAAGVVQGNIVEALYYGATALLDGPNAERFLLIGAIEAAGGDPLAPPPENADFVSNHVLIRLDNLVLQGTYTVTTPWGTFDFTTDPARPDRIVATPLIAIGTAADLPTAFGNAATGPINNFFPNGTGGPGFLGDSVTPAALIGANSVFTVTGPGGINVSTTLFTVEGKLFGAGGGLTVEQATVATGATPQVVVLASSNLATPTITVSGAAGTPIPNEPITLTAGPAPAAGQPQRFSATFPLGVLNPVTQQLVFTANSPGFPPVTQTVGLKDVVAVTNASADLATNTLTVNAASSFAGLAAAPGLTVVDQNAANLGTITAGALSVVANPPPSQITVNSTAGGSTTVPVTFVGAAAGGGTPPPTTPPPTTPPPPTGGFIFVPGQGFVPVP